MLMSIKVADSLGFGTKVALWEGLWYALRNGADVACLALGWPDADGDRWWWREVLTLLADSGLTIIADPGYGPGQIPRRVWMPAAVPPPWLHPDQTLRGEPAGVIAVAVTDSYDLYFGWQIGPTEWGDFPYVAGDPDSTGLLKPDLRAPGIDVISLDYRSDTIYEGPWWGSDYGTACAAGAAALLLSACPALSPADLDSILEMTAVDLATPGKDNSYGAGRVDVWAAYKYCVPGVEEEPYYTETGRRGEEGWLECSPNPSFGPVTISYCAEHQDRIMIQILDCAGRIRQELSITGPGSGQETIRWDGTDSGGMRVPSGIYFVRLSGATAATCRKIVLMD
jgi:hypothetical protein